MRNFPKLAIVTSMPLGVNQVDDRFAPTSKSQIADLGWHRFATVAAARV
jgi:hypothetical protein